MAKQPVKKLTKQGVNSSKNQNVRGHIDKVIAMVNDASKERLRMLDSFSSNTNLDDYEDTLIKLSTIDQGKGVNPFMDLDDRYAEEPYPSQFGVGQQEEKKTRSGLNTEQQRQLALQLAEEPEIDEVIDKFLDEMIVYDAKNQYFVEPLLEAVNDTELNDAEQKLLKTRLIECFDDVYEKLNFNNKALNEDLDDAESIARTWLSIGKYAWYMVFDDIENPTNVEKIVQLDLREGDITRYERPTKTGDKLVFWVYRKFPTYQRKRDRQKYGYATPKTDVVDDIVILDSQLLHLDWEDTNRTTKPLSYVSTLERTFNIYRTMTRTRISWAIMNSIFRTIYRVPIKGKGKIRGEQTVNETMSMYRQKVDFDDSTGRYTINNKMTPRINFEMWTGDTNSGSVQVDTIGGDGPDIDDVASLQFYRRDFHKASKMPTSRFDDDQPTYWADSPQQISRDERQFGKYIRRIQRVFGKPVWKAWYTQLIVKYPEYSADEEIRRAVQLLFRSYNIYEKMLEMEMLDKSVTTIEQLRNSLAKELPDGKLDPYFSMDFLISKYMPLSAQELADNAELRKKEKAAEEEEIKRLKKEGLLVDEEPGGFGARY